MNAIKTSMMIKRNRGSARDRKSPAEADHQILENTRGEHARRSTSWRMHPRFNFKAEFGLVISDFEIAWCGKNESRRKMVRSETKEDLQPINKKKANQKPLTWWYGWSWSRGLSFLRQRDVNSMEQIRQHQIRPKKQPVTGKKSAHTLKFKKTKYIDSWGRESSVGCHRRRIRGQNTARRAHTEWSRNDRMFCIRTWDRTRKFSGRSASFAWYSQSNNTVELFSNSW